MKIEANYTLIELLFGKKSMKGAMTYKDKKNSSSKDSLELSDKGMKIAQEGTKYVEAMKKKIENGEPLGDISYDDYARLMVNITHETCSADIDEWKQAKMGWKSMIETRLWRTESIAYADKEIVNSKEFQEDYQNYLTRYANGENLTVYEKKAMMMGSSRLSKCDKDYLNASNERLLNEQGEALQSKMDEKGIQTDGLEFTIVFQGYEAKVEGIEDDNQSKAIEDIINGLSYREIESLVGLYNNKDKLPNYFNSSTKEERNISDLMNIAEYTLKQYDMALSDLKMDSDGSISGLPKELEEAFHNNRVGYSLEIGESYYTRDELVVYEQKESITAALKAINSQGYENIERYNYMFHYSNGKLNLVDCDN